MKGTIHLKMVGWELIQNNNIICIFLRKLDYFSSTRTVVITIAFSEIESLHLSLLALMLQIIGIKVFLSEKSKAVQ